MRFWLLKVAGDSVEEEKDVVADTVGGPTGFA